MDVMDYIEYPKDVVNRKIYIPPTEEYEEEYDEEYYNKKRPTLSILAFKLIKEYMWYL